MLHQHLCVLMLMNLMVRLTVPNRSFILFPVRPCLLSQMIMRSPYLMNHNVISVYLLPQRFYVFRCHHQGPNVCMCSVIKTNWNVNQ